MTPKTAQEALRLKFQSGNATPVERATILRGEWEAIERVFDSVLWWSRCFNSLGLPHLAPSIQQAPCHFCGEVKDTVPICAECYDGDEPAEATRWYLADDTMKPMRRCPSCDDKDTHIVHRTYDGGCEALVGRNYCYAECMPCGFRTADCWEGDAEEEGFESMEAMATFLWNLRAGDKLAGAVKAFLAAKDALTEGRSRQQRFYVTSSQNKLLQAKLDAEDVLREMVKEGL